MPYCAASKGKIILQSNNKQQTRIRINNQIRILEVRVISDSGDLGIMPTNEALNMAREQNLDLVEINPKSVPPIVKIMNYGKFKYEEKKKLQINKKNQVNQAMKEICFHSNTDQNDMSHKVNQAKGFLEAGDKVKFSIRFRGREIAHNDLGREKLQWCLSQLTGLITSNWSIGMDGKVMSVLVFPSKK